MDARPVKHAPLKLVQSLVIEGDDTNSKYKDLFAELRRRGINPDDFAGGDDGGGGGGNGSGNTDQTEKAKKKGKKALTEKERLAWAMLTKPAGEGGSLQGMVDGELEKMQEHIDSKEEGVGNNFLRTKEKPKKERPPHRKELKNGKSLPKKSNKKKRKKKVSNEREEL